MLFPLQTVLSALILAGVSVCLSTVPPLFLWLLLPCLLLLLCFRPPSLSLLHVISFFSTQDYESKLQALQKQVETRSLAAETTEEEEEEEEGEIQGPKLALIPFASVSSDSSFAFVRAGFLPFLLPSVDLAGSPFKNEAKDAQGREPSAQG